MRTALICVLITMGLVSFSAFGADTTKPAGEPKMSPEEVMAAYAKLSQPGEAHNRLAAMAGEFKATTRAWFGRGEPHVSEGVSKNEMILGGRWLKCDFGGQFGGREFKGIQLMGFDGAKRKYVTFWIDEMSTGAMIGEGTADESGKVITVTYEFVDPMTNKLMKGKNVYTIVDKDKHLFEMYEPAKDGSGKEVRTLEITYTRVK